MSLILEENGLRMRRRKWKLHPDPTHVICRPHLPGGGDPQRVRNIIDRVLSLSEPEVAALCERVIGDFSDRHRNLAQILERHYQLVERYVPGGVSLSAARRTLLGAYFTMEYSVSSAALFNPSMVRHPDQGRLKPGELRFIMSLRAVGEGHISSLVFRSGTIDAQGSLLFDPVSDYVETPMLQPNPSYGKRMFMQKLQRLGVDQALLDALFTPLGNNFTYNELQESIDAYRLAHPEALIADAIGTITWLAHSNYELDFQQAQSMSERVIFPASQNDKSGIEDARFVEFTDDDGTVTYYATYTAYDGTHILPQLIETQDFSRFRMFTLSGQAVKNKGMALFPQKINGRYVMLGRQDGESNYIMSSEELHIWQDMTPLQHPMEPWEYVQIGNCGSPIRTERGWLVLTHGVGPMREYSIGAILLDLEQPQKVVAKLKQPLLRPHAAEREGYVPNVVYSCGGLVHNGELMIPYAMSDTSSGLVSVNLEELLRAMTPVSRPA